MQELLPPPIVSIIRRSAGEGGLAMARLVKNRCSFCGKRHDQVRRVIAGPGGVLICNECVALCNNLWC